MILELKSIDMRKYLFTLAIFSLLGFLLRDCCRFTNGNSSAFDGRADTNALCSTIQGDL
jgi:hypothetical protein